MIAGGAEADGHVALDLPAGDFAVNAGDAEGLLFGGHCDGGLEGVEGFSGEGDVIPMKHAGEVDGAVEPGAAGGEAKAVGGDVEGAVEGEVPSGKFGVEGPGLVGGARVRGCRC